MAELSSAFLIYLMAATVIAAIGILTDSVVPQSEDARADRRRATEYRVTVRHVADSNSAAP